MVIAGFDLPEKLPNKSFAVIADDIVGLFMIKQDQMT